jgi:hypothetical protein
VGGSPDLKLEGLRGDTRFIQVRVARVATLRPVLCSISRPALGVIPGGIGGYSAKYPTLLYIVQGAGS